MSPSKWKMAAPRPVRHCNGTLGDSALSRYDECFSLCGRYRRLAMLSLNPYALNVFLSMRVKYSLSACQTVL